MDFYKLPEQVPTVFNKFQPKLVYEQLQCRVTVNHPLKYYLRRIFHQKEVRNIQSSGTLFVCRHIFQYRTDRYGLADIGKHGSLLLPLFCCAKVGHQYHIPMSQYSDRLFVETAVLSSCRQPQAVLHGVGCNECRLLTFHNEHGLVGVADKKMLAEETLAQVEVGQTQLRMYPAYVRMRNFQPVSGLGIISHNLPRVYLSVGIHLPENCRTAPFLGSPDLVKIEKSSGIASANRVGQECVQRIDGIV